MAILLDGLTKTYANGRGIHGISLAVEPGEVFGFLGPNGAGKSTTIRTIMGFLRPDAGRGTVLGHDIVRDSLAVRAGVGYLPSDLSLYDHLTGAQNIAFSLKVRGRADLMKRAEALARRLDVDLNRRLKTLSRGQKQKVAIIAAMAHDPPVLIFDEPTTGLDPLVQDEFHRLLREEVGRGKTLFMSSHILSEVEALCDRVAVIRDGRIVAIDAVASLKRQRVKRVAVTFAGPVPDVSGLAGVSDLHVDGQEATLTFTGRLEPLLAVLAEAGVADVTIENPSLEEVFRTFYGAVPEAAGRQGLVGTGAAAAVAAGATAAAAGPDGSVAGGEDR